MRSAKLFPVLARIRKSSKYFHQGADEKGRARLSPLEGIDGGSGDGYIYRFRSNRYRAEDVDLFTWTARGGLQSLSGKAVPAKDRCILEFDAMQSLLSPDEREAIDSAQHKTVGDFLKHARELITARSPAVLQAEDPIETLAEEVTA